jgi:type VI secretion system protein ImpA
MSIEVAQLLASISPDRPCGDDISFDEVYDRVRDARRADDPTLRQGEWQTELKVADWRLVIKLATDVLSTKSKDLQMVVWLGEALIATEGVRGATQSMELLNGLLDTWWEQLYPELDGDDADERAAKLAWYNIYASDALRRVPLSAGSTPVNLLQWQDSREVDNLGRQSQDALNAALDEGRLTGEAFDKAMLGNPADVVQRMLEESDRAMIAFEAFKVTADKRLGRAAPSLAAVEEALKRIRQIVGHTAQAKGIGAAVAAVGSATMSLPSTASSPSPVGAAPYTTATTGLMLDLPSSSAARKEAALRTISDIAAFFRRTEPHNPVAFMLDKAVAWANTPLDAWLVEVVKDSSVLSSIRDRVGIAGD